MRSAAGHLICGNVLVGTLFIASDGGRRNQWRPPPLARAHGSQYRNITHITTSNACVCPPILDWSVRRFLLASACLPRTFLLWSLWSKPRPHHALPVPPFWQRLATLNQHIIDIQVRFTREQVKRALAARNSWLHSPGPSCISPRRCGLFQRNLNLRAEMGADGTRYFERSASKVAGETVSKLPFRSSAIAPCNPGFPRQRCESVVSSTVRYIFPEMGANSPGGRRASRQRSPSASKATTYVARAQDAATPPSPSARRNGVSCHDPTPQNASLAPVE